MDRMEVFTIIAETLEAKGIDDPEEVADSIIERLTEEGVQFSDVEEVDIL